MESSERQQISSVTLFPESTAVHDVYFYSGEDISSPNYIGNSELIYGQQSVNQDAQILRDVVFNRPAIIERGCGRLFAILHALCQRAFSRREYEMIIKLDVILYWSSYSRRRKYIVWRFRLQLENTCMCPIGHMAATGKYRNIRLCPVPEFGKMITGSRKCFYIFPSTLLYALLIENNSFDQLMSGWRRAKRAVIGSIQDVLRDCYDENIFLKALTWINYVSCPTEHNISFLFQQMVLMCLSQVHLTEHVGPLWAMPSTLIFCMDIRHELSCFVPLSMDIIRKNILKLSCFQLWTT